MDKFSDSRGLLESIKCPFYVKEVLLSTSYKNVFRGFHKSPYRKYIIVKYGKIHDIYITDDGRRIETILSNGDSIIIPSNSAHGFKVIDDCQIIYLLEEQYNKNIDEQINWRFFKDLDLKDCIMSEKDKGCDFLVLGGTGYLGSNFVKYVNDSCIVINNRLDDLKGIESHIKISGARYIVCAAGLPCGQNTTEWCETHEEETKKVNYTDVVNLINLCNELNVHLTYFGSCLNDGKTVYSKWRKELESKIHGNVLYLRLIYPCTFDGHPRCFATKMKTRIPDDKFVKITNLNELFPILPSMIRSNLTGIHDFVSPGEIHLRNIADHARSI